MFLKDLTNYELYDRYVKANWYLKKFFVEVRELEDEMDRRKMIEYPFTRTDCQSYEESFCEARDCGECDYKEITNE